MPALVARCCCLLCWLLLRLQVYYREWLSRFDELWAFADHTAGACHAAVVCTHYTSERNLALLRDSGMPILCQVRLAVWVAGGSVRLAVWVAVCCSRGRCRKQQAAFAHASAQAADAQASGSVLR